MDGENIRRVIRSKPRLENLGSIVRRWHFQLYGDIDVFVRFLFLDELGDVVVILLLEARLRDEHLQRDAFGAGTSAAGACIVSGRIACISAVIAAAACKKCSGEECDE
ncbi:hypothetical protein D3C74_386620 [compost metagenome]